MRAARIRLVTVICSLVAFVGVWGTVCSQTASKDPALGVTIAAQVETDTAEDTTSAEQAPEAQSTHEAATAAIDDEDDDAVSFEPAPG